MNKQNKIKNNSIYNTIKKDKILKAKFNKRSTIRVYQKILKEMKEYQVSGKHPIFRGWRTYYC